MRHITRAVGAGNPGWWKTVCAVCVVCAATAIALPAQTFTTLHSFDGTDGANSSGAFVQGLDGNLYGTTGDGGVGVILGGGTVFKITPTGALTTLYNFCSETNCTDGEGPAAGLALAADGKFYGTTLAGGVNNEGVGTVFKISPTGTLTTLYSFCAQMYCFDGEYPEAGLILATNGNFYGTTWLGGFSRACGGPCGTVFKITPTGTLTTLESFDYGDGADPEAGLVQGLDGNFYGTTSYGGAEGYGTVLKITPGGTLTTLHSFDDTDGAIPLASLLQASDGNFYGTTNGGGVHGACVHGCGTVFEITPTGALTTLHTFCTQSKCPDGSSPIAGLVQGTDGNFYGTTYGGGAGEACRSGCGTLFKITPTGTLTTLHSFHGAADGDHPYAGLTQATSGAFYGTAYEGGTNSMCTYQYGCGTVFTLNAGLGPFVESLPALGKEGTGVEILGTNLAGATSVTFNGTPAVFTVVSPSLISTSVPVGATTGFVKVKVPGGTLTSNAPFRVRP